MNEVVISIVSTLYNYRQYVAEMIESVQKQTWSNWKLIIVDDASEDKPFEVICPYIKNDKRIQFVALNKNGGYSKAKNEGIILSGGEYIVMIDADDLLTSNSLEWRYEAMQIEPDKKWCHGDVLQLGKDGVITDGPIRSKTRRREEYAKEMDLTENYHHRLIHSQGIMVRREFHKTLGLYDEKLRFSSDNEMFRRAIRFRFIPVYCNKTVAVYRRHGRQMCKSEYKAKRVKALKEIIKADVEERFKTGINSSNTRIWT